MRFCFFYGNVASAAVLLQCDWGVGRVVTRRGVTADGEGRLRGRIETFVPNSLY